MEALLNEIKALRTELSEIRTGMPSPKIHLQQDCIYNNKELQLILGVDNRLVKKYRDNGILSYHRQDDKYWYYGQDIIDFLHNSRYQAFA